MRFAWYKVSTLLCIVQLIVTNDLSADELKVAAVLNKLHHSAAEASSDAYFSCFADDAIFIGTDASEYWTVAEFKAFAEPYFARGKGWTYHLRDRKIYFASDKKVAWFAEQLHNDKYGQTRATGVLEKVQGHWKLKQYHLTIPIPNALALPIVKLISSNKP